MKNEIKRLVQTILIISLVLGIPFLIAAIFTGFGWDNSLLFLFSIILANVPEGLMT